MMPHQAIVCTEIAFLLTSGGSRTQCDGKYVNALQCEVMVTAGANQAFTNIVLTLLDTQDKVVLFKPFYFNHLMAVQMTGGADNIVYGRYNIVLSITCLLNCCNLLSLGDFVLDICFTYT